MHRGGDYPEIPMELILQQPALEAYSILSSTFTQYEDGSMSYPYNFAGVWIEDFKLHIALTSTSKDDVQKYADLLSNFVDYVVFAEANFSLNLLNEIRDNVAPIIGDNFDIHSHHVDVVLNSINFEVSKEDYAEIERLLEEGSKYEELDGIELLSVLLEGLDYSDVETLLDNQDYELNDFGRIDLLTALFLELDYSNIEQLLENHDNSFNQAGGLALLPELFVFSEGEEILPESTQLRGGMQLQRRLASGGWANRTLGVGGTILDSNGNVSHQRGIVTAAHGLEISGANQILFRNGAEFGRVNVRHHGSNGDWALVRLTNNDILTNRIFGTSTAATRNIVGALGDLPRGSAVMSFGASTGFSRAEVTEQNVSLSSGVGGITRARLIQGSSAGGDSGGPYYVLAPGGGNNYVFVGVHQGSNVPDGGSNVTFTPYRRFSHRFRVRTTP